MRRALIMVAVVLALITASFGIVQAQSPDATPAPPPKAKPPPVPAPDGAHSHGGSSEHEHDFTDEIAAAVAGAHFHPPEQWVHGHDYAATNHAHANDHEHDSVFNHVQGDHHLYVWSSHFSVEADEGQGLAEQIGIVIYARPTGPVTISYSDPDYTVTPASQTVTLAEWDAAYATHQATVNDAHGFKWSGMPVLFDVLVHDDLDCDHELDGLYATIEGWGHVFTGPPVRIQTTDPHTGCVP